MKKIALIVFLCMLFWSVGSAQWYGYYPTGDTNELDGGIGITWIDNQAYYQISFQPDISIGKFGIGLGLNLLYNVNTGKIRSQDWDTKADYARIIRYLRYGYKGDSFYARVGAINAGTLGHGLIMNYYNNQINYDMRKLGMAFDLDLGVFGFETFTNNLGRFEVVGGRAFVRPLYKSNMFMIKNLAFGGTYVTDLDPDSWKASDDKISEWGVDVELPIIKTKYFNLITYFDHAQINNFGSGQSYGFKAEVNKMESIFDFEFVFERRNLGKQFISNYFGPFYEILRNTTLGELIEYYESLGGDVSSIPEEYKDAIYEIPVTKQMLLPMMSEKRKGWFGGLRVNFLRLVTAVGTYQKIDGQDDSGLMHMGAALSRSIPFISLEATYDKWGVNSVKDAMTLDYRSVARFGVGYKIKPYLLLYMDYIWNFKLNNETGRYEPQERFQPRLAFRYNFGGF